MSDVGAPHHLGHIPFFGSVPLDTKRVPALLNNVVTGIGETHLNGGFGRPLVGFDAMVQAMVARTHAEAIRNHVGLEYDAANFGLRRWMEHLAARFAPEAHAKNDPMLRDSVLASALSLEVEGALKPSFQLVRSALAYHIADPTTNPLGAIVALYQMGTVVSHSSPHGVVEYLTLQTPPNAPDVPPLHVDPFPSLTVALAGVQSGGGTNLLDRSSGLR